MELYPTPDMIAAMVQRYVFLKLDDAHATDAGRAEVADKSREVLSKLEDVSAVVVGIPADEPALRSWDISIVVEFESLERVASYRDDPAHRAFVDEFLAPRIAVIKAWNFEVS